jgi:CPA1 family monovalent cation:H+ antiporter
VGLVVGQFHLVQPPRLTKEMLFALFLPGLVFEAAYNLHAAELREGWRTVTTLAAPGVIAAIGLTAAGTTVVLQRLGIQPDFTWRDGLVFAALVSATDPIAVVSVFRRLGVARRLTTLIEAESLFNDGTSIVALTLILAYVGGEASSVGGLAIRFVLVVCGGGLIGGIVAYVITAITRRLDDPMIEITLTTITAYGSFALAEDLHLSGVIATVVAGLVLGTHTRETAFSPGTRVAADSFWQYVAFALNSIVFLLIGFEVRPRALLGAASVIGAAFVVVVLSRLVIVFVTAGAFARTSERIPIAWSALLTWGGLRGALAMVLALALAPDFPHRTLLVDMTFGVVVASLLVQGLTIPAVTHWLLPATPAAPMRKAARSNGSSSPA